MGNCAIKPKVLKDSDEDMIPVERDTTVHKENAEEEMAVAAARRSEKGKEILLEDDVDNEHNKQRPSLSLLFHEDKTLDVKDDFTQVFPPPKKPHTNNITNASSESLKLDTSPPPMIATNVNNKAQDTFDVKTRSDLEVKIPKNSNDVKTRSDLEVKITKESNDVKTISDLEVKIPKNSNDVKTRSELEVKIPKESNDVKTISDLEVKIPKESNDVKTISDLESKIPKDPNDVKTRIDPEVKIPKDSKDVKTKSDDEVKIPQDSDDVKTRNDLQVKIPKDSNDVNTHEANDQEVDFSDNWEVKFPEELEAKVTKESNVLVPQVLEDKNIQEDSRAKSNEVKAAESELLKVSQVESQEGLETKVPPQVFEINLNDQETSKIEFVDVPKVLEAKNNINQEDSKGKTNEVKAAESELLKVSQVESHEGLEIINPIDDQEAIIIKTLEEKEFLDANEKINDKHDQAKVNEDINVTKDKETILSDSRNKSF
ncbi:unnamed protein product [Cochlearia groenlandica]